MRRNIISGLAVLFALFASAVSFGIDANSESKDTLKVMTYTKLVTFTPTFTPSPTLTPTPTPFPTDTVIMNVIADTYLDNQQEDEKFGDDKTIRLRSGAVLTRFDLSSISSTVDILQAFLVYYTVVRTNAQPMIGSLYTLARPWEETDATFNQAGDGQPWQQPGAFGVRDRNPQVIATPAMAPQGWTVIDVASVIKTWLVEPNSNYGFLLQGAPGELVAYTLTTKEGVSASQPHLRLRFHTATPTSTLSVTPTFTASPTASQIPESTPSVTPSASPTASHTPTATRTTTPSPTSAATPTVTPSITPTYSPTSTPVIISTDTPTHTPTALSTMTPTNTPTLAMTPTDTPTSAMTPTDTPTPVLTMTPTNTPTSIVLVYLPLAQKQLVRPTSTPTPTPTRTPTAIPTLIPCSTSDGEPNNTFGLACGPLISNHWYTFQLGSGGDDEDYYRFDLPNRRRIELWLTGIQQGANFDLLVYDENRELLGYSGNLGQEDEEIVTEVVDPATYRVRVYRRTGSGLYQLRVVFE